MSNEPVARSRRRVLIIAAAVVAVLGIALGSWAVASGGGESTALVGTWRPTFVAGYDQLVELQPDTATITFGADGKWHGSDGCNAIGGNYKAGAGTISADSGPQTAIGCANVPNAEVIVRAARWDITGNTLTLYDDQHATLATYVRA